MRLHIAACFVSGTQGTPPSGGIKFVIILRFFYFGSKSKLMRFLGRKHPSTYVGVCIMYMRARTNLNGLLGPHCVVLLKKSSLIKYKTFVSF